MVNENIWLVVWNHGILWLSIQLGMSSSQLTNSYFFRGVGQPPTSIQKVCKSRPIWRFGSACHFCWLKWQQDESGTRAIPIWTDHGKLQKQSIYHGKWPIYRWFTVYLLKMVIFHGKLLNNQMVSDVLIHGVFVVVVVVVLVVVVALFMLLLF